MKYAKSPEQLIVENKELKSALKKSIRLGEEILTKWTFYGRIKNILIILFFILGLTIGAII